jgi:hypothetical protein
LTTHMYATITHLALRGQTPIEPGTGEQGKNASTRRSHFAATPSRHRE